MHCTVSAQSMPSLANADDAELIRQLKAGSKASKNRAFQVIYQRYAHLVYSLALRVVHSAEDAEDITQEIFLVLHHRCSYDASRGSLKNFLAMTARSRAIDRLRSQKNQHKTLTHLRLLAIYHTAPPPIEHLIKQQLFHRLRAALFRLPLPQREVLENAYYKGLTQAEISREHGLPLGTVKSRSHQGLKKLRGVLTEENG